MPSTVNNNNKLYRENSIKIVGTLKNADIKTGNRRDNGQEYVSVNATIESFINGKNHEYEVSFFASRLTRDGKESQLFNTYSKMNELVGKKVDVSGDIRENRYWSTNLNQMISAQQLSGRFINVVDNATIDAATFVLGGFVVRSPIEKTNKNGDVYRYDVSIGQSNYKGDGMSMFVLHINPDDREILAGVEGYEVGSTVKLNGVLDFTVEQVTVKDSNGGFGESVAKTYTNKQKNFFIKGGSNPIDGDTAYTMEDTKRLISAYKAHDEEIAGGAKSVASEKPVEKTQKITARQASLI